jgi:PAS domain-containing protein
MVADGSRWGTFAIYHDITELNRQRRFLEALLEVSPEAIVTTDLDDTVTSWNRSAERLFGYTAEEALGQDIDELVSRRADLYAEGKELNRGPWNPRWPTWSPSGPGRTDRSSTSTSWVAPSRWAGELVAKHVFYHDISELQEQKRYFQSLLEISPTAIVITDLDSKIVLVEPRRREALRVLGGGGRWPQDRRPRCVTAGPPRGAREYTQAAARGERIQAITQRTRKDGSLSTSRSSSCR